jgi:hypothetical protein
MMTYCDRFGDGRGHSAIPLEVVSGRIDPGRDAVWPMAGRSFSPQSFGPAQPGRTVRML